MKHHKILDLAASGLTTKETAAKLGISHNAVKMRRCRMFVEMGTLNIVQAVAVHLQERCDSCHPPILIKE
jgi:DNA-binding CsgD family transcriptional regulator